MINIYLRIIKQLHNEIFSFIDEFEGGKFFFDSDSTKLRFKTDDNLIYDEKDNIPVCVISRSSVIKKDWIYCPILKLQKCLITNIFLKKYKLFLCLNIKDGLLYLL